jgi:proline dehydrogenase
MMRSLLLSASQNVWLRTHVPRCGFARRAVARFMPGEELGAALAAAQGFERQGVGTVFTRLGENVTDPSEAAAVTDHYLQVLDEVRAAGLGTEVSVKLTQLGLDLRPELCYANLARIVERAGAASVVWIDMEASNYVDVTLEMALRARAAAPNVGVCVQSYLYRTEKDLESLIPSGLAIRLVKGAYKEPPDRAFPRKRDVDENYFKLAQCLLADEVRASRGRVAIATHDLKLIRRIQEFVVSKGFGKDAVEFQLLYGIQRAAQWQLAQDGWRSIVLVAYGTYWYPWYMRRLAERPANLWFVMKNVFAG